MKGYKFIKEDMKSKNGDHKWEIGKWYKEQEIELCEKGFHACREPLESLGYVYGGKWFIVEARGKIIEEKGDKFVAQEMKLVRELDMNILKRFAIWCAKQCLENYEKEYTNDKRVFEAIEGAELYLDGKIDLDELRKRISAAKSAARSAWLAAWSAESAKSAAKKSQNKQLKELIEKELITPENIQELKENEIFVFGSNLNGRHEAGAAKLAKDKFGAKQGIGEGLIGQSYAFPTLDKNMKKQSIKSLKESVKRLRKCAKDNPEKVFLLTKVGCGIAGFKESEIKKLFTRMPMNVNKPKGW